MGKKVPRPTEEEIFLLMKATGYDRARAIALKARQDGVSCGDVWIDGKCQVCGKTEDEHHVYE